MCVCVCVCVRERDRQTDRQIDKQTDRWTETGKSFYRCFVKAILLILWLSSLRHSHEKYLGFCNKIFVVCFFDRLNVHGKTLFFLLFSQTLFKSQTFYNGDLHSL